MFFKNQEHLCDKVTLRFFSSFFSNLYKNNINTYNIKLVYYVTTFQHQTGDTYLLQWMLLRFPVNLNKV
jgi:hypothetical protein